MWPLLKTFPDFPSYYVTGVLQKSPAQQVPEQNLIFNYHTHHLFIEYYVPGTALSYIYKSNTNNWSSRCRFTKR